MHSNEARKELFMEQTRKNGRIVGTSLLKCIVQMVQRNVDPEDVEIIFTGTKFCSCKEAFETYEWLFERYTGDSIKCAQVLGKMWNKVVQPRMYGVQFTPLKECWWYPSYEAMQDYYHFYRGDKMIKMYDILYARVLARKDVA
ncbi:MAG: hypothetical protein IJ809_04885 [Clostridia bacterium]|nr:hypothetical protein [Clostridia bacterium]